MSVISSCADTDYECDCDCSCGILGSDCDWPDCGCGCLSDCKGCALLAGDDAVREGV